MGCSPGKWAASWRRSRWRAPGSLTRVLGRPVLHDAPRRAGLRAREGPLRGRAGAAWARGGARRGRGGGAAWARGGAEERSLGDFHVENHTPRNVRKADVWARMTGHGPWNVRNPDVQAPMTSLMETQAPQRRTPPQRRCDEAGPLSAARRERGVSAKPRGVSRRRLRRFRRRRAGRRRRADRGCRSGTGCRTWRTRTAVPAAPGSLR